MIAKDKARLLTEAGLCPKGAARPQAARKVGCFKSEWSIAGFKYVNASGGTNGQSLCKLNLQEPHAARVIEVKRVTICHPDRFQPYTAGAAEAEMQTAIFAAANQSGLRQTELIFQDVFTLTERLMDKSPQFIQAADGVEGLGHRVVRPETVFQMR